MQGKHFLGAEEASWPLEKWPLGRVVSWDQAWPLYLLPVPRQLNALCPIKADTEYVKHLLQLPSERSVMNPPTKIYKNNATRDCVIWTKVNQLGFQCTGHKRQQEQNKASNEQNYIQLSSENISPCITEAESHNQYHEEFWNTEWAHVHRVFHCRTLSANSGEFTLPTESLLFYI